MSSELSKVTGGNFMVEWSTSGWDEMEPKRIQLMNVEDAQFIIILKMLKDGLQQQWLSSESSCLIEPWIDWAIAPNHAIVPLVA